ncbi:MAG: sulfatase [Anaerolineae bacterium]|jgi:arylsulfatase A-like enzyme
MKAIMLMFDSLNRHYLPCYGNPWVQAPNFQRLAQRTVVFDNAYVGSMPCMPARRELHTGRLNFLHRSWGPLEPFDDSLPEILRQNGIHCHLASDHGHYWEDGGATYHQRYSTWANVRGQEGDRWKAHVGETTAMNEALQPQDRVNRQYLTSEELQPQTLTVDEGLAFLEKNHGQDNWFLHIETFDPHEPFYTMEHYKALYPDDYTGPDFDWPPYRPVDESEEQVQRARNNYAALVTMCDRNLGRVLDALDRYQLWDDTLFIVNTDHGFMLGEHDWWAKCVMPFYGEVAHTPLFIWDPQVGRAGVHVRSLAQTIDLPATVLSWFGLPCPPDMEGQPLQPVLRDDTPVREAGLFGIFGGQVNVTDGRYVYMRAPATVANTPLNDYTLMPTHMRSRFAVEELRDMTLHPPLPFTKGVPVLQIPTRRPTVMRSVAPLMNTVLYDLQNDPGQEHPLDDPVQEARMIGLLLKLMQANDAPPEQYQRLGLPQPE